MTNEYIFYFEYSDDFDESNEPNEPDEPDESDEDNSALDDDLSAVEFLYLTNRNSSIVVDVEAERPESNWRA